MAEKEIGKIMTYFMKVGVAAITLTEKIKIGQKIRIKGHTTDFTIEIKNMEVNRKQVGEAEPGDNVGIPVPEKVRPRDIVYLVEE